MALESSTGHAHRHILHRCGSEWFIFLFDDCRKSLELLLRSVHRYANDPASTFSPADAVAVAMTVREDVRRVAEEVVAEQRLLPQEWKPENQWDGSFLRSKEFGTEDDSSEG